MTSLIDDINKASGKKSKIPKTPNRFITAVKSTTLKEVALATLGAAAIVLGLKYAYNYTPDKPVVEKIVTPPAPVIEVPIEPKTKIVYRNKVIYRYRDNPELKRKYDELMEMYTRKPKVIYKDVNKIVYRDREKIVYKYLKSPDLEHKKAILDATYRRRARILEKFYASELKPGESQKLTFVSKCPQANNNLMPVQKYRQRLN